LGTKILARVYNEKKLIPTDFSPGCFLLQGIPRYRASLSIPEALGNLSIGGPLPT